MVYKSRGIYNKGYIFYELKTIQCKHHTLQNILNFIYLTVPNLKKRESDIKFISFNLNISEKEFIQIINLFTKV